ncbi:hypothetical protein ACFU0X_10300 [Streptomyces cellulosae]|uniref:Secreted protein n=1 Tax=Streptomyces cellulosae TaxID=1968 RepID=A0ABW6JDJ4_STRCE
MLKKAFATAAVTGVMLAAGAGSALAAENKADADLPDTIDICNAPTAGNPEEQDSWVGLLTKTHPVNQVVKSVIPGVSVIAGVCSTSDREAPADDEKGDNSQGGSEQTPGGGEKPFPAL